METCHTENTKWIYVCQVKVDDRYRNVYKCPSCGSHFLNCYSDKYCRECGSKIIPEILEHKETC